VRDVFLQNDFINPFCEIRLDLLAVEGETSTLLPSEEATTIFKNSFTRKSMPESAHGILPESQRPQSGLDCLMCAMFARQRPNPKPEAAQPQTRLPRLDMLAVEGEYPCRTALHLAADAANTPVIPHAANNPLIFHAASTPAILHAANTPVIP
jgi:hypothetical protein